jgi:translation initiation factor 4G
VTPEPPKEVVKEEPKKKVPTLPVIVRLETAEQRAARLEEEAQKKKIQEIEEKEEKERQERKARQAKEAAEKVSPDDQRSRAIADEQEEKERQEKEAAAKEKEAAEERRKMEEAFAAEEEAEKKAAEEREAVAKAARDAEEKEKAEKLAQAAQEAREKADEKTRALVTPIASTPASPVAASPAPAAAGLPPKPVAAAAATPAGIPRRPVPSALEISPATPSMPTLDTPAPASALSTARPIEDLSAITYPAEVKGPQAELNAGAEAGKYRYDRNFLMQFMDRCKDKPDSLPPLEEIGLEAESSSGFGNRSSGRGGSRSSMGGSSRGASTGLGIGGIGNRPAFPGNSMGSFGMGSFGSGTLRGSTSEERYNRSLGSRQSSMARTPSQGGAHGLPSMSLSTSRSGTNRSRGGVKRAPQQSTQLDPDMAPLTVSATSWVKSRPTGNDEGSPEYIERKIKSLLNKLTAEKFDSISAQILDWANKSTAETDGMTLKLVIKQIFEKATDEAHWSSMYARLCRFLLDRLDPAITETFDGKPVSGGMLFRKYLVGRCQLDFESGWKAREDAATAAAAKSEEDKERLAAQGKEGESGSGGEPAILSDEYYAAQKAKRRGLGLVQLIGELYKLSMIGKGVIRTCFIRLLSNVESPDEEDMESSCKLLTTVGAQFDQESKDNMDIVFERLNTVANSDGVSSRVKFMIMVSDVSTCWRG